MYKKMSTPSGLLRAQILIATLIASTASAQLPDLTVSGVSLPATAKPGDFVTVRWTENNIGSGSASGLLVDLVYIAHDSTFNQGTAQLLGSYPHSLPIGPGVSETDSTIAPIPTGLSGTYYVFVLADGASLVAESNENNNVGRGGPVLIGGSVGDLQVLSVIGPLNGAGQLPFNVSYSVRNNGPDTLGSISWYDQASLSLDTLADASDISLGISNISQSVAPGETYIGQINGTVPSGISGTYYVLLATNAGRTVAETNFSNNVRWYGPVVISKAAPDVAISQVTAPAVVNLRQDFLLSYTVSNVGDTTTAGHTWTDFYFLSTDSVYDPADRILASKTISVSINPGQATTISTIISSPADLPVGTYYIIVRSDYLYQLGDLNTANNTGVSSAFQYAPNAPDLVVTGVQIPSTVFAGQQIDISWTVKNQGNRPTQTAQWQDQVYLSQTSTLDIRAAVSVGTFQNVSYLNPGDSYSGKTSYRLPINFSGPYYVFAVADAYNTLIEISDTNNTSAPAGPMQINIPPLPDLQIPSLITPSTIFSGQPATISWTVQNMGPAAAGTSGWSDIVFLSADSNLNTTTARLLGAVGHFSPLAPDSSSSITTTVTVPNTIFGTYYLFVVADLYDQVYEGPLHANNTRRSGPIQVILSPPPDLVVTGIGVPATGGSGQILHMSYTVTNNGAGAPFEAAWTDRIFLSSLPTFNRDSATFLQKVSVIRTLPPDSSYTKAFDLKLPDGIAGTYYIYVYTDADSSVFEFHADNNNVTQSSPIALSLSPWPDLQVTDLQAPTTGKAGDKFAFSFTVTNRGSGTTGDSLWVDRVYIHTKPSWDTTAKLLFSSQHTHVLSPGGSYTVDGTAIIPTDISGGAYLYVYTDASQSIYERTDEGNNIRGSALMSITAYPPIDVQVASLNAPPTGGSGKQIAVTYSVTNAGLARTLKNNWNDVVFFSPDTFFLPASMTILGGAPRLEGLDPLGSYTRTIPVQLPQGSSGKNHLLIVIDTSNTVDSSPANNRRAIPITVNATPLPDLIVTDVALLDPPMAGQPIRVRYTVHNNGPGPADAATWSDAVYISSDSLPGPADQLMATRAKNPPLDAGSSYTDTARFEIPTSLSGVQWVIVRADHDSTLYEGNGEGNNYRAAVANVNFQPPADLIVESIQIPPSAAPGQDVDVSWVIRNLGPNAITGVMRDAVYFSTDTIWTVDDLLLGIFERTISIAPTAALKMAARVNTTAAVLADSLGQLVKPVPGIDPGSYHVIVRTDIRNNIIETNETNNLLTSPGAISVGIPDLPIGVNVSTPLAQGGSVYYHFLTPARASVRITLTSDHSLGTNEMFARLGQAPTPGAYDYLYDTPQSLAQTLMIPETQAGDYYLLVHSALLPGGTQNITLRADTLSFQLTRVTPTQGGNAGEVTVKLEGARFTEEFQAYLRPAGNADTSRRIWSKQILFSDPSTAYATFDLRHAAPGAYDVVFHIPGAQLDIDTTAHTASLLDVSRESILAGAFHVVGGGGPRIELHLLAPSKARQTLEFPITLEVVNLGENDAPAPVIYITSPNKTPIGLTTPASPDESSDIQVLVLGPEGRRDVIAPGQVTSVRLFAWAKSFPSSVFLVQDITTTGLPLNWDAMEPYYRDESSPADWDETWRAFKTLVGPTWESFQATLRRAAMDRSPGPNDRAYAADALLADIFAQARQSIFSRYAAQNPTAPPPGGKTAQAADIFSPASINGSCDCQTDAASLAAYTLDMKAGGALAQGTLGYPGESLLHWLDETGTDRSYHDGDEITNDVLANEQVVNFLNEIKQETAILVRTKGKAKGMSCGSVRTFTLDQLFSEAGFLDHLSTTFNFEALSLGITLGHVPGEGHPKPRVTGQVLLGKICRPDCKTKTETSTISVWLHMNLKMSDTYNFCPGGGQGQGVMSDKILNEARQLEACGWAKKFNIFIEANKYAAFEMPCDEMLCGESNQHPMLPPCTPCGDPDPCNLAPLVLKANPVGLARTNSSGYTNIPPDAPPCDPQRLEIPTVNAMDPNEIAGPNGSGDKKWVAVSQTLPYQIRFENDPKIATAPAQVVSITQKLDTTADARSVRLSSLGFGRFTYDINGNRSTYSSRLDVRDSLHLFVDVTAGIDITTNRVFATFSSIDPATGLAPTNPLSGFLPVDDSVGHGQGFVSYTVRPRPDTHTGDSLHAKATVVFDNNSPLDTPTYINVIDAGIPVSRVHLLPASIDSTTFRVSWGGTDDSLASGLKSFTIFASDDDSTYSVWLKDVKDTSAVYRGEFGKTYRFFSIAADNAGNVEPLKSVPDASTLITGVRDIPPIPTAYALLQNYPNPFNPSTTIRFDVPVRGHLLLQVFDILGQLVMTVVDGQKDAGAYGVTFDARRFASGVYIYRMTAGSFVQTRKMLLLK